jgi:spermidine/putrescine transport system permease protein
MAIKPNTAFLASYRIYVGLFFVFLAAPLVAAGVFAFNDSLFPSLPWQGFTLDWFFNDSEPKLGMFHDRRLLRGLYYSFVIASFVSLLSVFVGTCNAFLFVRCKFPAKDFFYIMMVLPLVIPGVILGISILLLASNIANGAEEALSLDLDFLRPGIVLVVLGQFSFITTITSLVIIARLRKFDRRWKRLPTISAQAGHGCSGRSRCRSCFRRWLRQASWRSWSRSRTSTRRCSSLARKLR